MAENSTISYTALTRNYLACMQDLHYKYKYFFHII